MTSANSASNFKTADGVRLQYYVAGHGDPVLLWHGFLGTSYTWRKVVPLLADKYTVIVPDMRGYGDSDKPQTGYDAETLTSDFRQLVSSLGTSPIHIIAHDMGAPPALLWAAKHPQEVRTLTYLDEPVITQQCLSQVFAFSPEVWEQQYGGLWWWAFAFAKDMVERLIPGNERAYLSWFYENYSVVPDSITTADVDEYVRTFSGTQSVAAAFGVYRSILDTMRQTDGALSKGKVKIPVLALGGEKSLGDRGRSMMEGVAKHTDGGAIEGCGHFIPEEKPEALVHAWKAFVESI